MRYFKNEPTKLTLGSHQYTPTKDSFFKTRNNESYRVERPHTHNYIPPTPSGHHEKNTSSRYLSKDQHRHSYVPNVVSNKTIEKRTKSWPPPPTQTKNLEPDAKSAKPTWPPPRSAETLPQAPLAKTQPPEETAQDKEKREAAARKLQAFVRGTMCRARVSDMLLGLIEGLLSEKERKQKEAQERQRQQEEQKLQDVNDDDEYEDVVEVFEDSNSQQDIFAALDVEEEKSSRNAARSILKEVPNRQPSKASTESKGRSVGFVEAENQVLEIERAMEYARLPLWWMESCPHGILPEDEADERFAVVPPNQWNNNETMEKVDVEVAERYVSKEADDNKDEEAMSEAEIVEEEIVEETSVNEEPEDEPQPSQASEEEPWSSHNYKLALTLSAASPVASEPNVTAPSPNFTSSTQQNHAVDDEPDPSSMSLKDRMNAFTKGPKAPVKRNFRAATFR
jgi:hypothetical protein